MKSSTAITIALLALGSIRIGAMVLHRPIYGYGNSFDFYRLAQWYGISDTRAATLPAHATAPLAKYFLDAPRVPHNAYLSSELVFLAPALWLSRLFAWLTGTGKGIFDIRWLGAVHAIALIGVSIAAVLALRRRSGSGAIALAALFAFVLADPVSTLFMNTLYCEFSAVFFTVVSIAALVALHRTTFDSWLRLLVAAAALVALGLSKFQNQALPVALFAVAATFWLCRPPAPGWKKPRLAILGVAVLVPLAIQNRAPHPGLDAAIRQADATDTWFGAVLPQFHDPTGAVREAGLPKSCAEFVGRTWYSPGMQPPPCPEVAEASRARALWMLATEPSAAHKLMVAGAAATRPWLVRGYGQVEGGDFTPVSSVSPLLGASLSNLTDVLPDKTYLALLFLLMLAAPAFTVFAVIKRPRPEDESRTLPTPRLVATLLAVTVLYAFVTTILGDGFIAATPHFLLGELAFWPALLVTVGTLLGAGVSRA